MHVDIDLDKSVELIDLSVPISPYFWEPSQVSRKIIDHKRGGDLLGKAVIQNKTGFAKIKEWLLHKLGYGVDHRDFPDKKGLSLMHYSLSTHTGTHMDAPYHYGDVDDEGMPAKTISDIPLVWCFARGVVIDVSQGDREQTISQQEVVLYLKKMRCDIHPNDIVLLYSGGDKNIGKKTYFTHYRGVSPEVIQYLTEKGVKIIGIDSFSFDPPFSQMIEKYRCTKDKNYLWPSHMYGRKKPYCQLERLTNLNKLFEFQQFKVCCFPVKLHGADAAWCRVVAIAEK